MIVAAVLSWVLSYQMLRFETHLFKAKELVGQLKKKKKKKKKRKKKKEMSRQYSKNFLMRFLSYSYSIKCKSSPFESILQLKLRLL